MPLIKFEIDRVRADQINHLVSQTEGGFQAPEFSNTVPSTNRTSRAIAREEQPISHAQSLGRRTTLPSTSRRHLTKPADGGSERGLFFLKGRGWDPETEALH